MRDEYDFKSLRIHRLGPGRQCSRQRDGQKLMDEPAQPAERKYRLNFKQNVTISVGIDLNEETIQKLKLDKDDINRFIQDRQEKIVEAASRAAGKKIVELLQAYAEEFCVPISDAYRAIGLDGLLEARERYQREFGDVPDDEPGEEKDI